MNFKSICDWLTAVGEHPCEAREIELSDHQGTTLDTCFLGFTCKGCGEQFQLGLAYAKCMPVPLRPYLSTKGQRIELARRFNEDSKAVLLELRNSGGWFQPDPGVAMLTLMAAAMGPPGNPMAKRLDEMVAAKPKPQ